MLFFFLFIRFVAGTVRAVRAVPKHCAQHLPDDAARLVYVDPVLLVADDRLVDLHMLRTPQQRRTNEPEARLGRNVFETNTLSDPSLLAGVS